MNPQDLTPAAVVGGVLIYMAKSIYELVTQRKSSSSPEQAAETHAILARLSSLQEQQTRILEEMRQAQAQLARDMAMLLAHHRVNGE